MRKIVLSLLLVLLILIAGCTTQTNEDETGKVECVSDNECTTGGCSGVICQSKNTEPIITTCEYKPEYACYREISCGCINNKCQWDKTQEFDTCIEEARSLPPLPPKP